MVESVEKVNQDMIINSHFLKSGPTTSSISQRLFNANGLMKALKKRNEEYQKTNDNYKNMPVSESLRQLSQKAMNIAKFKNYKLEKDVQKIQLIQEYSSELYWENFTFVNQEQFVQKHQQFLIHKTLANSFKKNSNTQKAIKNHMMNCLKGLKDDVEYSSPRKSSQNKVINKSDSNIKKYRNYIKRKILAKETKFDDLQQFEHLQGNISYLWKILSKQLKNYSIAKQMQKPNPQFAIINASISMIESQFRQELPNLNNQREVSQYMRKKYLSSSVGINCQINRDGLFVWAVPFAYYKVGAWSNFAVSLNGRGKDGITLTEQFRVFQQQLEALNPTPQNFLQASIDDVFYKQLISIVKGLSVFEQPFATIGSLDLIWLTLKTLNIYAYFNEHKRHQLQQILQAIFNHFQSNKQEYISNQTCMIPFIHFLYLSAYRAFISYRNISQEHGITTNDFLHILLVLQSHGDILVNETYEYVLETLENQIALYLNCLVRSIDCKDYAMYYVLAIPKMIFKNVVEVVCNSWDNFNAINHCIVGEQKGWTYIKNRYEKIDQMLFQNVITNLLKNLVTAQKNYEIQLKIVKQAEILLSDAKKPINQKNYLDFVIHYQCNCLLRLKSQEEVSENVSFYQQQNNSNSSTLDFPLKQNLAQFLKKSPDLQQQFGLLVKFLQDYTTLEQLKKQKIITRVQNFLRHEIYVNDLVMLMAQRQNGMKQLFRKLEEHNALKLFFIYMKNVICCQERVCYLKGAHEKLRNFKKVVMKTLSDIRKKGKFKIDVFIEYLES